MAKFRQIYTNFWSNTYVQDEMTAEDKYFYLYLMTNEFTKQIGIYQITKKQMAFDLGYSIESVNALIKRFEEHHKLIKYDAENKEIVIIKWGELNLNRGGKPVEDLIKKELSEIKNKKFLEYRIKDCPNPRLLELIKKIFLDDDSSNDSLDKKQIIDKKNDENKKANKINTFHDTYDDAGAIKNKEERIRKKERKNNINEKEIETVEQVKEKLEQIVCQSVNEMFLFGKYERILKLISQFGVNEVLKTLDKAKNNKFWNEYRSKYGNEKFIAKILEVETFCNLASNYYDEKKKEEQMKEKQSKKEAKALDDLLEEFGGF